jgi:hypothetical protein
MHFHRSSSIFGRARPGRSHEQARPSGSFTLVLLAVSEPFLAR